MNALRYLVFFCCAPVLAQDYPATRAAGARSPARPPQGRIEKWWPIVKQAGIKVE